MSGDEKKFMIDGDEVAFYKTDIKGWVSRNGMFFGDGEHSEKCARWDGATHRKCRDCPAVIPKSMLVCDNCSSRNQLKRWHKLPRVPYEGQPLCLFDDERFFSDDDEFFTWCEDEGLNPDHQMVVICEKVFAEAVDPFDDYEFPDSVDYLPNGVQEAYDAFAKALQACRERDEYLYWEAVDKVPVFKEAE